MVPLKISYTTQRQTDRNKSKTKSAMCQL